MSRTKKTTLTVEDVLRGGKKKQQKSNKNKKYGRHRKKAKNQRYLVENRSLKNKIRKMLRHINNKGWRDKHAILTIQELSGKLVMVTKTKFLKKGSPIAKKKKHKLV